MVQMFTSRAELLDKGETTAEHLKHREEESGRLDRDKANTDTQHGGLFRGLFKEKPAPLQPVVDLDDGVMRCPVCSWELADDEVCAGCGYEYHGESDGTDYTDEDSDLSGTENYDSIIDDEADDDGFGDIEDDDPVWGGFALPGAFPQDLAAAPAGIAWHDGIPPFYQPGAPWPPRGYGTAPSLPRPPPGVILTDPSEYDEHYIDEENEYDEQDSFIDDEEHINREDDGSQSEHSTVMGPGRAWQAENSHRPVVQTISSDEVEDEDEDEDEEDSVVRRPHRRRIGNFSSDDDDEEEEEEEEEGDMDGDERSLTGPGGPWGIPALYGNTYHDALSSPTQTEETDDGDNPEIDIDSAHRYYQNVVEESEESESSDVSSPPARRPTRPVGSTGVTFGNAITIDDSEEEQPVGPVRRQVQRRQPRYSPY